MNVGCVFEYTNEKQKKGVYAYVHCRTTCIFGRGTTNKKVQRNKQTNKENVKQLKRKREKCKLAHKQKQVNQNY